MYDLNLWVKTFIR